MFLKPFKVKTNSQLKGSDRKKFRSALERWFPAIVEESAIPLTSKEDLVSQAKIVCHNGEIIQLYTVNGDPVAYESRSKWYLTVYGVWAAPSCVPSVLTWAPVIKKLANGADLMAPGCVIRPENHSIYAQLKIGDIVQIRVVGCSDAVGIGVMIMDGKELVETRNGKAVQVLQLYGDHLWEMGSKKELSFGQDDADDSEEEQEATENAEEQGAEDTKTDSPKDGEKTEEELQKALTEMNLEANSHCTPEAMDELLQECFLSAIKCSQKSIELPILTSIFYSNYVMPCAPEGRTVEVKRSSYKKVSTFLARMKALGYVDIKEEKKGVEHIVSFNLEAISTFKVRPEFHPKVKDSSSKDSFSYQMPEIRQTFLVTAEVLPILKGYTKRQAISLDEIRAQTKQYVIDNELQTKDKRIIQLEPVLAHIVLTKNEFDSQVTWEMLNRRVLSRLTPAFEICFPNREPILKTGAIEPIVITIATRSGNKKVTLIHGFETYGIDPSTFAHQVQIGVSASTTVNPLPNNNKDWQQVLIQGNQVNFVAKLLLESYKIPRNYIRGLELAPKKKK